MNLLPAPTFNPAEKKVRTLQEYGFRVDQVVHITGRKTNTGEKVILVGRQMRIVKASKAPNMINGFLINPKTGLPQKTLISIPYDVLVCITTSLASIN